MIIKKIKPIILISTSIISTKKTIFVFIVMKKNKLHIISFANPFPPNYGGVIDVFYKIKALHEIGVQIYLHCFVDDIPELSNALKNITKEIFFYKNKKTILNFFSFTPYSIKYRNDKSIIYNLKKNDVPVLFESMKTISMYRKIDYSKRFMRLHNIEFDYFFGIYKSETNVIKKCIFLLESFKYYFIGKKIKDFNKVIALSINDFNYITNLGLTSTYLPLFHGNSIKEYSSSFGKYAIFSGDLKTSENKKSLKFIVSVFEKLNMYKLVIVVNDEINFVNKLVSGNKNMEVIKLYDFEHLKQLYADAHIAIMYSFQQSGTKLKLVNALYNSRHCLINDNIVDDPRVTSICNIANSKVDFENKINYLIKKPYTIEDYNIRKKVLLEVYDDNLNAIKLSEMIFKN